MEQFQPKEQVGRKIEQEKNDSIILEIGCGKSPFFLKAERKIKKNEHYVGIDLFPASNQPLEEWLDPEDTKDRLKKSVLVEGKADLISASGNNLPLKNSSVKEIIFKDVFGSPFVDSVSFASRDILDEKDESQITLGKEILIKEIDSRIWSENKKNFYKNEIKTKKYTDLDDKLRRLIRHYYYIGLQKQAGYQEHDIKPEFIDETFRILEKEGLMTIIETRTPDIALRYIEKIKNDPRFLEISSEYNLNDFIDSDTKKNKFSTIATFKKK